MEEQPQEGGNTIVRELVHVGDSKRMEKYAEEIVDKSDGMTFGTIYVKKGTFGDSVPEKIRLSAEPVK